MSLRIFSRSRLQEAFKLSGRASTAEYLTRRLMVMSERFILTCALYRLILSMAALLLLIGAFSRLHGGRIYISDYFLTFFISVVIFSVFGLGVPHVWSKYAGEKVLSYSYFLMLVFSYIVWPVLYCFGLYDGFMKRLTGVADATPQQLQDEKKEELLSSLQQRRMEDAVDEEEREMIENVLGLDQTNVDEIMTPRTDIVAVKSDSGLQTVLDAIISTGHSRLAVYEGTIDNIIGFVYAKDMLNEIGRDAADFKLAGRLREAYFVPETKPLRALLHEFQTQKLHIAVVLDEYGGTAGIVSIEDILEELVGEITDEYEKVRPRPARRIDPATIETDARSYVDDLNDEFDLNLPENEDYGTVGGFVFSHLGYIPKTGESFDYKGLKFVISSAEPRRIRHIRIQKTSGL